MKAARHRESTERGPFVAKMVSWILLISILTLFVIMFNVWERRAQLALLTESVVNSRAEAKAAKNELIDYISRSVQRWQVLADANPQLTVPKVSEPQPPGKNLFSKDEIQRSLRVGSPVVTPVPHPTPTPTVKVKIKRVYVAPKSTPYRWPWESKKKTR